jgi:hypothetical protein
LFDQSGVQHVSEDWQLLESLHDAGISTLLVSLIVTLGIVSLLVTESLIIVLPPSPKLKPPAGPATLLNHLSQQLIPFEHAQFYGFNVQSDEQLHSFGRPTHCVATGLNWPVTNASGSGG